jgi:hypothetical protein
MRRLRFALGAAPWRAAAYLLGSIVVGTVLFTVVVTLTVVAGALVVVGIGVPLLLVAAAVVRAAAHVERQRAALVPGVAVVDPTAADRPVDGDAVDGRDAVVDGDDPAAGGSGLRAAVRRRWTDPAMGPSLGYLAGLYVPLLLLDAVAVGLFLSIAGVVTVPFWYWAVPQTFDGVTHHGLFWGSFPHGPGGPDAIGLAIDDLPTALAVAGAGAVVFVLVACPLVVAAARLHARVAGRLLGPPVDPLARARAVLRSPGPLPPAPRAAHLAVAPPPT